MAKTRVRLKLAPNFAQILERQLDVRSILHEKAEEAAEIARSTAPVDSGRYRDSIEVDDNQLVSTDWKAHFIEFGTIHNRAMRTLTNAAARVARTVSE